jgi:hypothetical protein
LNTIVIEVATQELYFTFQKAGEELHSIDGEKLTLGI